VADEDSEWEDEDMSEHEVDGDDENSAPYGGPLMVDFAMVEVDDDEAGYDNNNRINLRFNYGLVPSDQSKIDALV